jgi:hypothetical protein
MRMDDKNNRDIDPSRSAAAPKNNRPLQRSKSPEYFQVTLYFVLVALVTPFLSWPPSSLCVLHGALEARHSSFLSCVKENVHLPIMVVVIVAHLLTVAAAADAGNHGGGGGGGYGDGC